IATGDIVALAAHDARVTGPAWIMPGQAARTVTLFLGYGRRRVGRVGNALGYDTAALRPPESPWSLQGVSLDRTGDSQALAATQLQHGMAGEDLVRIVPAGAPAPPPKAPPPSLYRELPLNHSVSEPAWGMVIDLDRCTGCNACAIACQAENNVPVVGREQVAIGRAMHWLRIARYYRGAADDPQTAFQPVPCMHCEKAPCEQGCPVHATVHGPDGTNQMVYNRCIGTRTCASYCPYKVRRFNFFDFTTDEPGGRAPQRNPNVTVRTRGVMEKCTYCVQRISAARVAAEMDQRPIADGEIVTACQAVCPAQAITFGNIADPDSAVARARRDPHHYTLLDHLATQPRTGYLPRRSDERET
ncbi:MAG: 4Fe-4S dicluster domain-containing protein, partial [Alphaproteobacteria bacterium]|nr:4Fe-4S dicluster domain-containing protein [Alphaproteobacteria bacterium]